MLEEKKQPAPVEDNLSRRNFFVKAGAMTMGMAVAGGFLGSLLNNEAEALATIPFPYKKLNLDKVRKYAFDGYFAANCSYGAAYGLITALREACGAGSAWDNIPIDMFKFGGGGVNGWGTICGAVNASMFVINLCTTSYSGVGGELLGWYTRFPFPTTKLDAYSTYKNQVTTVADSPLCHNSVSTWCKASDFGVNSAEKKHRCAKLTGDVAAKTADMLNKLLVLKRFKPAEKFDATANFCMACHAPGNVTGNTMVAKYKIDSEQGKMTCGECHDGEHDHNVNNFVEECTTCHK